MSTQEEIQELIVENLSWTGAREELTDDYPLIEKHVIDSLGMLKLVSLIEEHFGIEVRDDDLVPTNFGTVKEIATLVEAKRSSGSRLPGARDPRPESVGAPTRRP